MLKIVDFKEDRAITPQYDDAKHIISLEAGKVRHSLQVELPDGTKEDVRVSEAFYTKALALTFR